jgi:hypothetical protein
MVTITQTGNDIYIKVDDGETLNSYELVKTAEEGQWIALLVETGEDDITKITYDGNYLTAEDVAEATSMGAPAGSFILWVKAENLPKTFVLGGEGKESKTFTVSLV